jgi:hypothetical protein
MPHVRTHSLHARLCRQAHFYLLMECFESLNIGAPILLRRSVVQTLIDEHASENQEHDA